MCAVDDQLLRSSVQPAPRRSSAGNNGEPLDHKQIQRVDWAGLVRRIEAHDPGGDDELYRIFFRGVRFYVFRQLGPNDIEDKVHDIFLIVLQAIRRGDLRDPERLMGFVRTITQRQVAAHIHQAIQNRNEHVDLDGAVLYDPREDPEAALNARQREELMTAVLREISSRDREILTRFYLKEQTQEEICHEMNLTETQFRLLKSRAKARFAELGKKKMSRTKAFI